MLLVHIVPCDEDILTLGNEYEYFYINFVPHSWDTETNKVNHTIKTKQGYILRKQKVM